MDRIFGQFTLQPHRQLLAAGQPVHIGSKALDVLSVLVAADGGLVTKDELMEAVWKGLIVEDNALQAQISQLRKLLGSEAGRLVAVHGRGYRLDLNRAELAPAAPETPLVAVLAFENRSGDPELSFFAEGVSDEVLQAIAQVEGIRVIAPTSSFQIKGDQRTTDAVATTLGATHILDGSVRRQENRLRIGAQLVAAASKTVLWSETFDGSMADVFALQDGIAQSVAEVLKLRIGLRAARKPIDPIAYDFFLRGRRLTGPAEEMRWQSIICFEDALAIEPKFADAWASLALAHALRARWDIDDIPFCDRIAHARSAAENALALNPSVAAAHAALGALEPEGNYLAIEEHFRRALQFAPQDSESLRQNASLLYQTGRTEEAFACVQKASATDPLNPSTMQNYGLMMAEVGRLTDSYVVFANARKRWPGIDWFVEPMLYSAFTSDWTTLDALLADPYFDTPGARHYRKTALALRNPTKTVCLDALAGAERQFERLGRVEVSTMIFLYSLGLCSEAFKLLERSDYSFMFRSDGTHRRFFMPGIHFSICNRAMRDDPRFVDLCAKLGLCAYWRDTGRWPDCVDEVPYDFRAEVLSRV